MALLTNSIGDTQFISLRGGVEPPSQQVDRPMARPGVPGVALWRLGIRGRPFVLRSMVDAPSLSGARMLFSGYRALIGGALQILIQDGHNFQGAEGFSVAVLDVRQAEPIRKILTAVGGINPPSGAKVVAEWTLIAVAVAT